MHVAPDPAALRAWFLPDRPGPLVGLHVVHTGHGTCFVDRWPEPRVVLAQTADNYELVGDPNALSPQELQPLIAGFLAADEAFDPIVRQAFPSPVVWPRVIFEGPVSTVSLANVGDAVITPLRAADAAQVQQLDPDLHWIGKTWGEPAEFAASGHAWGAFVDGRLAAVACSFFVGDQYEDIGVVTEPDFRGRGLSVAGAAGLCGDIVGRGRRPSWTTSPDNVASLRVAHKLGFQHHRTDRLLVMGRTAPGPARASVQPG